ncbi:hypothetical protein P7K49_024404 [Saguinus oedipus]|uniref:Uncharacterized protein n=1 Tax=Saguinus oedipus TaxID=9490 RepID=A0ABQ9UPF2_SAGOE|nr:hypothetical protein P7K49_024404 [Saguinus oedipus]
MLSELALGREASRPAFHASSASAFLGLGLGAEGSQRPPAQPPPSALSFDFPLKAIVSVGVRRTVAFPFIPPLDVTLNRVHFLLSDAPSPDTRRQMFAVVSEEPPTAPPPSSPKLNEKGLRLTGPAPKPMGQSLFISAGPAFPSLTPQEVNTVSLTPWSVCAPVLEIEETQAQRTALVPKVADAGHTCNKLDPGPTADGFERQSVSRAISASGVRIDDIMFGAGSDVTEQMGPYRVLN